MQRNKSVQYQAEGKVDFSLFWEWLECMEIGLT